MRHAVKGLCIMSLVMVYVCLGYQGEETKLPISKKTEKCIEIKGEVRNPGVYELAWDATVEEAIAQAGGLSDEADLSAINQTNDLVNGAVLIVPKKQETVCISINTATAEDLDTLPGIGAKIAQRIIEERQREPFVQLEDLKRVKGIGDKMFLKLQDHICL